MLTEMLMKKNLPPVCGQSEEADQTEESWQKRRKELIRILSENEYGFSPERVPVSARILEERKGHYAGKALFCKTEITLHTPNGPFAFPLYLHIPASEKPLPLFLLINFRDQLPDQYYPVEEIMDNGFATAMFCYKDITSDDADMTDKLAGLYCLRERTPTAWGKIGIWAWAASHCLDYLLTVPEIDPGHIIVCGHSRLGKTALWCAAQDERFWGCMSNDSGCGGSALSRGKDGETIEAITRRFPYWFCENYAFFADRENEQPFDQHFLLAAIAPRYLLISTAEEDIWADPSHELLCCLAASPAYEAFSEKGLVINTDEMPSAPAFYPEGNIGFSLRQGTHFYSRSDWNTAFRFFSSKTEL